MSVSYEKILTKMMEELRQATIKQDQTGKMKEHIRSIKLLSELILEEQQEGSSQTVIHNDSKKVIPSVSTNQESASKHEEANGNSIFDF